MDVPQVMGQQESVPKVAWAHLELTDQDEEFLLRRSAAADDAKAAGDEPQRDEFTAKTEAGQNDGGAAVETGDAKPESADPATLPVADVHAPFYTKSHPGGDKG